MIICLRWTTLLPANGIIKQSLLVSDFCTKRQKLKKKNFRDHITEHLNNNWGEKIKAMCIIMPEQAPKVTLIKSI